MNKSIQSKIEALKKQGKSDEEIKTILEESGIQVAEVTQVVSEKAVKTDHEDIVKARERVYGHIDKALDAIKTLVDVKRHHRKHFSRETNVERQLKSARRTLQ